MELPRTPYNQEFRTESVKFFKDSGLTLVEAAKRLSFPKGTRRGVRPIERIKETQNGLELV